MPVQLGPLQNRTHSRKWGLSWIHDVYLFIPAIGEKKSTNVENLIVWYLHETYFYWVCSLVNLNLNIYFKISLINLIRLVVSMSTSVLSWKHWAAARYLDNGRITLSRNLLLEVIRCPRVLRNSLIRYSQSLIRMFHFRSCSQRCLHACYSIRIKDTSREKELTTSFWYTHPILFSVYFVDAITSMILKAAHEIS